MAYDKVVDSAFLEAGLTLVGDSIRAKGGTSAKLEFPNGMKAAVEAIDTSKPEQTKTATPSLSQQTIVPDSGKVLSGVTVEPITSSLLTSLDPDFKPENIAKDANLFGLVGTHEGGSQVASGTTTASGRALTVAGLDFTPNNIMLRHSSGVSTYVLSAVNSNAYYFTQNRFYTVSLGVTFSAGGFSVTSPTSSSLGYLWGSYDWVAWAN